MRISRKAGLLASSTLCGALALGVAGPAGPAFSAVTDSPAHSASAAPLPGADALAKQNTALAGAGAVVQPVTDLVAGVLKAPDGKLPKDEATKHAADVKKALDGLKSDAKASTGKAARAQDPGPELVAKAAADLQVKVDALVKASAAGDAKATAAALQATLTGTVNVVVAIVLGGDLPAPDLKGLPKLPSLPGVSPAQTLPSL
ncbi:hypothetical protein [Streptomyces fractus]|uniref:hypothetical protein n=1 Tax=Streptomyces fractus TaxID=641806 RepID=UPI003CF5B063